MLSVLLKYSGFSSGSSLLLVINGRAVSLASMGTLYDSFLLLLLIKITISTIIAAVIAGIKISNSMTVATIAPTEELEDEAALLDGLTDPDADTDTVSDLDSDAVTVTDIDVDIVTDVDADTLLDANVTVVDVDGAAPEAVTVVTDIDADIVTDVDADTLLDTNVTVANVDGTAPEAVIAVATIK